jgi:predicted polyphosphate/ATP-dependent NAD kinase
MAQKKSSIGIIANPHSGKDVRRIVSLASSFSNHEKLLILKRVVSGLFSSKVDDIFFFKDAGSLGSSVVEEMDGFDENQGNSKLHLLDINANGTTEDSIKAAIAMKKRQIDAIIVLGGDGTSRAVSKGCGNIPLIPLSTGTNNVFPQNIEGTIAGLAAGFYANNLDFYSTQVRKTKCFSLNFESGVKEKALVDIALVRQSYAGAKAVWDISKLEFLALTCCIPGSLGLSSIGCSFVSISAKDKEGLFLRLSKRKTKNAKVVMSPIAPGMVVPVNVSSYKKIKMQTPFEYKASSPSVVAFDGEREVVVEKGESFKVSLEDNGPRVLEVYEIMRIAAEIGDFELD